MALTIRHKAFHEALNHTFYWRNGVLFAIVFYSTRNGVALCLSFSSSRNKGIPLVGIAVTNSPTVPHSSKENAELFSAQKQKNRPFG